MEKLLRGAFDLGGEKETAGMFAADAVSLWRSSQVTPVFIH
jgi:hypothetical protein